MHPSLEDLLLGVDELLAPAMGAAGFAQLEVSGRPRGGGVGATLTADPVAYLRRHGGGFPKVRWWYRGRPRGRVEILSIGFEHHSGDERWLEYDVVSGALDTSDWFALTSRGTADARGRVASVATMRRRLRSAAREVATAH